MTDFKTFQTNEEIVILSGDYAHNIDIVSFLPADDNNNGYLTLRLKEFEGKFATPAVTLAAALRLEADVVEENLKRATGEDVSFTLHTNDMEFTPDITELHCASVKREEKDCVFVKKVEEAAAKPEVAEVSVVDATEVNTTSAAILVFGKDEDGDLFVSLLDSSCHAGERHLAYFLEGPGRDCDYASRRVRWLAMELGVTLGVAASMIARFVVAASAHDMRELQYVVSKGVAWSEGVFESIAVAIGEVVAPPEAVTEEAPAAARVFYRWQGSFSWPEGTPYWEWRGRHGWVPFRNLDPDVGGTICFGEEEPVGEPPEDVVEIHSESELTSAIALHAQTEIVDKGETVTPEEAVPGDGREYRKLETMLEWPVGGLDYWEYWGESGWIAYRGLSPNRGNTFCLGGDKPEGPPPENVATISTLEELEALKK